MAEKDRYLKNLGYLTRNNQEESKKVQKTLASRREKVSRMMESVYGIKTSLQSTYNGVQPEPNKDAMRLS